MTKRKHKFRDDAWRLCRLFAITTNEENLHLLELHLEVAFEQGRSQGVRDATVGLQPKE